MPVSNSEKLKVRTEGSTVVITINNPPANTWDEESLAALESLVADCNADKDVYALVITGEGDKFFSAGRRSEPVCLRRQKGGGSDV